jgi:hypothetical protein
MISLFISGHSKGDVMASGSSDHVRSVAVEKYVRPALLAGKRHFSVAVKDLMKDLQVTGFPPGNYPQVCTALRTGKFLRENGLEIEAIDGPPSGLSTTVVVRYRVANSDPAAPPQLPDSGGGEAGELPAARAHRLFEGLRGLLQEELVEYGGGEAFIRWMRSEDEEHNAPGTGE